MKPSYIIFAVGLLLKLFSAYFVIIALFALKKPAVYPQAIPKTKFAVVIAARNEAKVIGELVKSLKTQDYPAELFAVYVVPNNCSDNTAEQAEMAGAEIIHCTGPVHYKGDALSQSLKQLMLFDYDAFVVFDADNVVDKKYLLEMNHAFCSGAKVAKGKLLAKNPYDSWVAGCYDIYFGINNFFFSRARAACGLSAKLVGTGFAVHRSVLDKMGGWHTITMAEDAEFSSQCALVGERVFWVPAAVSYDEEPNSFAQSLIQRKRWSSGVMQVAKLRVPLLLQGYNKKNRPFCFDMTLFLLTPFVQILSSFITFLTLLTSGISGISPQIFLWMSLLYIIGSYCGTALFAGFITLAATRRNIGLLKSVITFPLFMASWLPLQIIALFYKTTTWEQIQHSRNIVLEDAA